MLFKPFVWTFAYLIPLPTPYLLFSFMFIIFVNEDVPKTTIANDSLLCFFNMFCPKLENKTNI